MKDARAGIKASEKERDVSVVLDIERAFALNLHGSLCRDGVAATSFDFRKLGFHRL